MNNTVTKTMLLRPNVMLRNLQSFHSRHFNTTIVHNARKRLVILGTGWAGYSVMKNINKKLYDVIVVSPRNHFLFTPLLNSTTVGTLEFRSIIEPIRNTKFRDDHHFQLSRAIALKPEENCLVCKAALTEQEYKLIYDELVIAVGCTSNTFGIPGVTENTFFLKEISDARRVRDKIISNFELSLYPDITKEEREKLLHFVIVGGGPTGVEFGAELHDFITRDVTRLYSGEKSSVKVTLSMFFILYSFLFENKCFETINLTPHFCEISRHPTVFFCSHTTVCVIVLMV